MAFESLLRATTERVSREFPKFVISRQVLRMEQLLSSNSGTYRFQMKQGNNSTDPPLSNLLNDSDAFVLCGLSLGIKKQDTTQTPPWYGTYKVYNYVNAAIFTGVPAAHATEAAALQCIYNGKLSFRTGSLERIRPTDTREFEQAPDIQTATISPFGSFGDFGRAYVEQQPTFLIDGSQNNEFTLQLGAGDYFGITGLYTAAGAATNTAANVVVLEALGLIIQNGAESAKRFAESWQ